MWASYGLDEQQKTPSVGGGRCPGEADCSDFKKARGRTAEEKEQNACIVCPKFPTKPKRIVKTRSAGAFTDKLIERAEYFRQRRISGYPANASEITSLEVHALICLDAFSEQAEREAGYLMRQDLSQSLEIMQGIIASMAS